MKKHLQGQVGKHQAKQKQMRILQRQDPKACPEVSSYFMVNPEEQEK